MKKIIIVFLILLLFSLTANAKIFILRPADLNFTNIHVSGNSFLNNLSVSGDANFVAIGVSENIYFEGGIFSNSGSTQFVWNPETESFKVGFNISQSASGLDQFAFGEDHIQNCSDCFTAGFENVVTADQATAFGAQTKVTGQVGFATGQNVTTSGVAGFSAGITPTGATSRVTSAGEGSVAMGVGDVNHFAGKKGSIALGYDCIALEEASVCLGKDLTNYNPNSVLVNDLNVLDNFFASFLQDGLGSPTGFPNKCSDVTISFTDGTRTFSIQPSGASFDVFHSGIKFTKTTEETLVITDTEGTHYLYYDETGVLQINESPSRSELEDIIINHAEVSVLYWDATNDESIYFTGINECHGSKMDGETQSHDHFTHGTHFESGLAVGDITSDGTGNDNVHAQLSVTDGSIRDQDVVQSILDDSPQNLSFPANLPVFYRSGASNWRKIVATNFPVTTTGTGRLAWNEFTGGAWQLTEVGNQKFVLTHIFATNNSNEPVVVIVGQNEYNTQVSAREGAPSELNNLITSGLGFQEFVPITTIIFQTSNAYSNTVKARIRTTDTGDDYIDWRFTQLSPTTSPLDHGNNAGLGDDDHPQYVLDIGDWMFGDLNISTDLNALNVLVRNRLNVLGDANFTILNVSGNTFLNALFPSTITTTGTITSGDITIFDATPILVFKDSDSLGAVSVGFIEWRDSGGGRAGFLGNNSSGNDDLFWKNEQGGNIGIQTTGTGKLEIYANIDAQDNNIITTGTGTFGDLNAIGDTNIAIIGVSQEAFFDANAIFSGSVMMDGSEAYLDLSGVSNTDLQMPLIKYSSNTAWNTWFGGGSNIAYDGVTFRDKKHIRSFIGDNAGNSLIAVGIKDEDYPRLLINAGGIMTFGQDGTALPNANLFSDTADVLKTSNTFQANALIAITDVTTEGFMFPNYVSTTITSASIASATRYNAFDANNYGAPFISTENVTARNIIFNETTGGFQVTGAGIYEITVSFIVINSAVGNVNFEMQESDGGPPGTFYNHPVLVHDSVDPAIITLKVIREIIAVGGTFFFFIDSQTPATSQIQPGSTINITRIATT